MEFRGTARYSLRGELGRGGMGIVFAAYDGERRATVALKTIARPNPSALLRFKQEFRALADVSHRNLVSLYELASDEGQWFFTMELLEGADLLSYVRGHDAGASQGGLVQRLAQDSLGEAMDCTLSVVGIGSDVGALVDGPTGETSPGSGSQLASADSGTGPHMITAPCSDLPRLRAAFVQLAEGVAALHDGGHLHRDLKPSNVMVTPQGRVVILDFGVMTELRRGVVADSAAPAGTPAYMAPEQITSTDLTSASDWYSVGVILYQALTGYPLYRRRADRERRDNDHQLPPHPSELHAGVDPDLAELCVRLLAIEPGGRPEAAEILAVLRGGAPASPRAASVPGVPRDVAFVGRARELSVLRDDFATTRSGQGRVLYVSGKSGMGKSLLVRYFLDEARREQGAVILEGRCYQQESVPYKAVDSIVDDLSELLLGLSDSEVQQVVPPDIDLLARIFPVLSRVAIVASAGVRDLQAWDPQEVKRRAFAALRELLARLARTRPMVVFVDDLQWGDVDSAPLLDGLMRPPSPPALLLLASYRSEEAAQSPVLQALFRRGERLGPASVSRELCIGPLEHADAVALVHTLSAGGSESLDPDTVARESGGHPYFLQELVRRGEQERAHGVGGLSLDGMIARTVAHLPEDERQMLELVSVAGQPTAQSVISQAACLSRDGALRLLRRLQAEHLVRTTGMRATDLVEPYHDRIRETVTGGLQESAKRSHHHELAQALLGAGADADTLAYHFSAAGERATAAEYAVLAADQAVESLAFDKAAKLYGFALEAMGEVPAERTLELTTKRADALANAGRGRESAGVYLSGVSHCVATQALELQRCAALQYLRAGHVDEGLQVISDVLSSMSLRLPQNPKAALGSLLWRRFLLRLRGLGFRERTCDEVTAEELRRIDACWSVALGLLMVDTLVSADFQTRHLLLALRAGEPYRVCRALVIEAGLVCTSGRAAHRRVLRMLETARKLADEIGRPEQQALVGGAMSLAHYQVGILVPARAHADKAIEMFRTECTGVSWELLTAEMYRLWALFYLGEFSEMLERAEGLLEDARARGDLYGVVSLSTGIVGLPWIIAGRVAEAEVMVEEAVAAWSRDGYHLQHYGFDLSRAHLELCRGEVAEVHSRSEHIVRNLRSSMLMRIQSVRTEGLHLRARCSVLLAAADPSRSDCLRKAERDARALARDRTPVTTTLALLVRAGIASVGRGPELAAEQFKWAEEAAAAAELRFFAAAARRQRGRLLGGSTGEQLVQSADRSLADRGVVNPGMVVDMFVPARVGQAALPGHK